MEGKVKDADIRSTFGIVKSEVNPLKVLQLTLSLVNLSLSTEYVYVYVYISKAMADTEKYSNQQWATTIVKN